MSKKPNKPKPTGVFVWTLDSTGNLSGLNVTRIVPHELEEVAKTKVFYVDGGVSAAVVAMWLAQAAVQYLGQMAIAKILGHPSLRDIGDAIERAVTEIKHFIREELGSVARSEMQAFLESIVRNLKDFDGFNEADRSRNLYLVDDAVLRSGDLISLAKRHGLLGAYIFSDAVSLRVLSHFAKQRTTLNSGDLRAVISLVGEDGEARIWLRKIRENLENSWSVAKRLSAMKEGTEVVHEDGPDGFPRPGRIYTYYYCRLDGKFKALGYPAQNRRDARRTAEPAYQSLLAKVEGELTEKLDSWDSWAKPVLANWGDSARKAQEILADAP